jgi:hypothetical protein
MRCSIHTLNLLNGRVADRVTCHYCQLAGHARYAIIVLECEETVRGPTLKRSAGRFYCPPATSGSRVRSYGLIAAVAASSSIISTSRAFASHVALHFEVIGP